MARKAEEEERRKKRGVSKPRPIGPHKYYASFIAEGGAYPKTRCQNWLGSAAVLPQTPSTYIFDDAANVAHLLYGRKMRMSVGPTTYAAGEELERLFGIGEMIG